MRDNSVESCQTSAARFLLSARVKTALSSIWGESHFISTLPCRMKDTSQQAQISDFVLPAAWVFLSSYTFNLCHGPVLPQHQEMSD